MKPIPERQEMLERFITKYFPEPAREPGSNGHAKPRASAAGPSDEEVIGKCRGAENAAKFADLFDHGDTRAHGGDDSRADLSLLGILAFWTQDPAQLERLFDSSALGERRKWRNRPDYRRRTIDKALEDVGETYTWPRPSPRGDDASEDESFYSHHTQTGFGENKSEGDNPLPIKTVEEVISEAGEEVPWIIDGLLARGALTDFSGIAKDSGKTTFWCHAITAGAGGEEHAGFSATPAKYLYLTEQGNNFALVLRDSGLTEHPDHIKIVQFKDVTAVEWNRLMRKAGADAHRLGMDALVVDTFAVFARLKGSEENDAGPVADRMRVLRMIAQKYNIAVLLIRHAGKDGTPRGSSAFEAEADICIALGKPEGRHAPTVRHISGKGRYGVWERNIQLAEGHFVSLGSDNKVEFNRAVRFIKAVLPEDEAAGMKKQQILDARVGEDAKQITASTLDRALAWLVSKDAVGEKQLPHERGKPKIYWLKPDDIYSHQTPSANGENKYEPLADNLEPGESATVEQLKRIRELVYQGMSEKRAREEVLGKGWVPE